MPEEKTIPSKVLMVSMDFHTPKFEFHGDWIGKDIKTVSRLIYREYLKHNLEIRRKATTSLQEVS